MSRNIYRDVGCSQEDHLPNCSHFGMSGAYLSEHSEDCLNRTGGGREAPCICNPNARKGVIIGDAKTAKHTPTINLPCYRGAVACGQQFDVFDAAGIRLYRVSKREDSEAATQLLLRAVNRDAVFDELVRALEALHESYVYDAGVPGDPYLKLRKLEPTASTWALWEAAQSVLARAREVSR